VIKSGSEVESIPAILMYRVEHEKPSPVKKSAPEDGQKYTTGEWAAFINY